MLFLGGQNLMRILTYLIYLRFRAHFLAEKVHNTYLDVKFDGNSFLVFLLSFEKVLAPENTKTKNKTFEKPNFRRQDKTLKRLPKNENVIFHFLNYRFFQNAFWIFC